MEKSVIPAPGNLAYAAFGMVTGEIEDKLPDALNASWPVVTAGIWNEMLMVVPSGNGLPFPSLIVKFRGVEVPPAVMFTTVLPEIPVAVMGPRVQTTRTLSMID